MGKRAIALCLVALSLLGGCGGNAGPDRSMETVEITVTTPTPGTEAPPQPRTVRFPGSSGGAVISDGSNTGLVVDAGADRNATALRRAMARAGVERYDLWITGFNETRIGGAATLVRQHPPDNIGFSGLTSPTPAYDRFLRAVVDTNRQRFLFSESEIFSYGHTGGVVNILAPSSRYLGDGNPAHNELVLSYEAHGQRVLWLGDPGRQETQWLLETYEEELDAGVLVLSAGARPSLRLLETTDPETVVVQGRAGANRTAASFEERSIDVYRPAIDGSLRLQLRPAGTTVETTTPRTPRMASNASPTATVVAETRPSVSSGAREPPPTATAE